jgi:predicted RNA-binding protein associated with RNAse of E/G family
MHVHALASGMVEKRASRQAIRTLERQAGIRRPVRQSTDPHELAAVGIKVVAQQGRPDG